MKLKVLLIYVSLSIFSFIVNFLIYNYSFNLQATPFLHEEQRVDSALMMLKTTLPAYLVSSIVITILFYLISKKMHQNN